MKLWHTDISYVTKNWYERAMNSLPDYVFADIDRYHRMEDKKSRLLSRMMVQMYCLEKGLTWNWSDWKKDEKQKPYLENGPFFNISHAGDKVLVVFSEDVQVGVDVEKIAEIEVENLSTYFHADEQAWLESRARDAFFDIWTRKEALLKAIGIGILNGLNQVSVLSDKIEFNGNWHLTNIKLYEDYKVAACSPSEVNEIILKHLDKKQLIAFIDEKILI